MRLRLALLAAALALAAPALAARPDVDARAYFVQNAATNEVLLTSNAREQLPMASITKLMTVLVTIEHGGLDELVTVSGRAAAIGESTIYLRAGERIAVRDLIEAALIQSANDAARALAEHVGNGSVARFVELMNAKARALGLRDTRFVNPDGLDAPGHYSSARDVTKLARRAMQHDLVREIVRKQEAVITGNRRLRTWNDLLATYPGLVGVKTGHTAGAGWSQVAAAEARGVLVYATILGAPGRATRNADLAELLTWGLTRYRTVRVITTGRVYAKALAPYGRKPLTLVAPRETRRIVRVDQTLVERVVVPTAVSLPVRKGQRLGEVLVYNARGVRIARRPLVATRSIAAPSFLDRTGWYAGRTVKTMWSWVT